MAKHQSLNWTFLTNHAYVLLCLAESSSMHTHQIADRIGISENSVQHIIDDLMQEGYIDRVKEGRQIAYEPLREKSLLHPLEAHRKIEGLITFIQRKD